MKLNKFIEKLINIRDTNNAGDYDVMNTELVYNVVCGEIDLVSREPIEMKDEDIILDEKSGTIMICAQDNNTQC